MLKAMHDCHFSNYNKTKMLLHWDEFMPSSSYPIFFSGFQMKKNPGANFVVGFCIATAIFFIVGRVYAARKAMNDRPGSVADLVRRGQLRSDRRGMYDSNTHVPFP